MDQDIANNGRACEDRLSQVSIGAHFRSAVTLRSPKKMRRADQFGGPGAGRATLTQQIQNRLIMGCAA
jgi:hypothetical protein